MALKDITKKIISDAQKEAEGIIESAQKEAEEIKKETEKIKENMKSEFENDIKKSFLQKERSFKGSKRQELNLRFEAEKREIIDSVFVEAMKDLESLSEKDYESIVSTQVKSAIQGLDSIKIIAPEKRKKETLSILEGLNVKADVEYSKEFTGGIKIIGDDFEYDITFEKLIQESKKDLEVKVADILFGHNAEGLESAQKEAATLAK